MSAFIDHEAMEELADKFLFLQENMHTLVEDFLHESEADESINILFRNFHTIKALAGYLELKYLQKTAAFLEDILAVLRSNKGAVKQDVVDWFLKISDIIVEWSHTIERFDYELEEIPRELITQMKASAAPTHGKDTFFKGQKVLVYWEDKNKASDIKKLLEKKGVECQFGNKLRSALETYISSDVNLFLVIADIGSDRTQGLLTKLDLSKIDKPIMLVYENISLATKKLYQKKGYSHFLHAKLDNIKSLALIKKALKSRQEDKVLAFSYTPLFNKVESIPPLPQTIKEIQQFSSDADGDLRALGKIVVKDAGLSSAIMSRVNTPEYGLKRAVSSINQAITLLGKDRTIALCMSVASGDLIALELAAYGIESDTFSTVSNLRMNLMMTWYTKVSLEKTGMMMTAAMLGNIGQLVIAGQLKKEGKVADFKNLLNTTSVTHTEFQLVHTHTEDITANILKKWGMNDLIVEAIRYSRDVKSAPTEIQPYAVALHAIFYAVPSTTGKIDKEHLPYVGDMLNFYGLDKEVFSSAVDRMELILESAN